MTEYEEFPDPAPLMVAWAEKNRPDMVHMIRTIWSAPIDRQPDADLRLVASTAFATGKEYGEQKNAADRGAEYEIGCRAHGLADSLIAKEIERAFIAKANVKNEPIARELIVTFRDIPDTFVEGHPYCGWLCWVGSGEHKEPSPLGSGRTIPEAFENMLAKITEPAIEQAATKYATPVDKPETRT